MFPKFILGFLSWKVGIVSDEHRERFYQDVVTIEKGYQGKWSTNSFADYIEHLNMD